VVVDAPDAGLMWANDMTTIEDIKRTPEGLQAIREMFGEGVPVSKALAERRAFICQYCPENVSAGWWHKVKHKIADAIKHMLEIKHQLDLHTSNEESLKMCRICGCATPLIVWSPLSVLRNHMKPGELEKYPHACWKKIALKALGTE
jgi:hypothetical protein